MDNKPARKKTHRTLRVSLHASTHRDVIEYWEACPVHQRHLLFVAALRQYKATDKATPETQGGSQEPAETDLGSIFRVGRNNMAARERGI